MMKKEQIIYMKIKHCLLIGFCSILLFNCSGDTYVGELTTDDDAPLVEPIPIVLSLGMSDFEILTRGSGEVNNGNDASFWDNVYMLLIRIRKRICPNPGVRQTRISACWMGIEPEEQMYRFLSTGKK